MPYHTAILNDAGKSHAALSVFFTQQVRAMYTSEKLLLPVIANMQPNVETGELKSLLSGYSVQIEKQVMRLDEIFGLLLIHPGEKEADAMQGLLIELKKLLTATAGNPVTRDAAVIQSVQKAIHLKSAGYASLEMLASALGMEEISNLLHLSGEDEKDQDSLFTDIAARRIENIFEPAKH